jgi:hypothetical protein
MFTERNQRREFRQLTGKSTKSRDCSNNSQKHRVFDFFAYIIPAIALNYRTKCFPRGRYLAARLPPIAL